MRFNVLTDPWIPLDAGDGSASLASYVDVMSGARDAGDLAHPRDDVAFFSRMLLSALTQALFPPANKRALLARIDAPMGREEVMARVDEVAADFELFATAGSAEPWMQPLGAKADEAESATSNLLLDVAKHLLFRPGIAPRALCTACAVPLVYGVQAFTPKGGRGYSPGVRGAPPTTTMVLTPTSVRETLWANVLHAETAEILGYPPEPPTPWRVRERALEGPTIGLVEGLFWKPRSVRLRPLPVDTGGGTSPLLCAACGESATLRAENFGPCQQRLGGFYRHPMSPCVDVPQTKTTSALRYAHLASARPAWTSLADWLVESSGGKDGRRVVHPAPVVYQWSEQLKPMRDRRRTALLVLDYGTKDASIQHRVVESYALSRRIDERALAMRIAATVRDAELALNALRTACVQLHMKARPATRLSKTRSDRARKERDLLHEISAELWRRTEAPFWHLYEALIDDAHEAHEAPDPQDAQAREDVAYRAFVRALGVTARALFDAYSAPSLDDPGRVGVIAEARAALHRALPKLPAPQAPLEPLSLAVADPS